jgi:hypothetical protein
MSDKNTRDLYISRMKLQLDELNLNVRELELKAQETSNNMHENIWKK